MLLVRLGIGTVPTSARRPPGTRVRLGILGAFPAARRVAFEPGGKPDVHGATAGWPVPVPPDPPTLGGRPQASETAGEGRACP
jgi:hypothetical protein